MKSKSLPTVEGTVSDSSEQVIHLPRSREDTWTRSSRLMSELRVVLRAGGLIPFETSPCLSMEPAATDQN